MYIYIFLAFIFLDFRLLPASNEPRSSRLFIKIVTFRTLVFLSHSTFVRSPAVEWPETRQHFKWFARFLVRLSLLLADER